MEMGEAGGSPGCSPKAGTPVGCGERQPSVPAPANRVCGAETLSGLRGNSDLARGCGAASVQGSLRGHLSSRPKDVAAPRASAPAGWGGPGRGGGPGIPRPSRRAVLGFGRQGARAPWKSRVRAALGALVRQLTREGPLETGPAPSTAAALLRRRRAPRCGRGAWKPRGRGRSFPGVRALGLREGLGLSHRITKGKTVSRSIPTESGQDSWIR